MYCILVTTFVCVWAAKELCFVLLHAIFDASMLLGMSPADTPYHAS